ncbi:MAG: diguanylate cyclase [Rhizobiaceae bacterium]|nr:diguanylate cyclase [Rhizobiaceae bacterium]
MAPSVMEAADPALAGTPACDTAMLRDRVRLLEAVISNFPGGLTLFDEQLRMVLCNEELKRLLDYPDSLFRHGLPTLEDLFWFNAERGEYGPGPAVDHVARRMALVRKRRSHHYERTRPNGMIMEVRGVPIEGGGFLTTYLDVTEQRRNQALIAHMAHHDALTDLPNRLLFADRLGKAIALARRGGLAAIHCLDVDGFKPVNDRFGHQAGDDLLVDIARRLSATIREHDTVARLGGDEFAVIQTGIHTRQDAAVLAGRLVRSFERPFSAGAHSVAIGVSIGVALTPHDGTSTDELLSRADAALYRSKAAGRGRYTFFESAEAA